MMHNKNIDALHQHVAKEILPQEYGGCGDSIQKSIGLFDSIDLIKAINAEIKA